MLLSAPDTYMEKIAVGSGLPSGLIDLDNSVEKNIKLLADAKNKKINQITACILKRPRHDKIISILNSLNVKINFIQDGDVTGVISVTDKNSPIDIYLGVGGGPEGVLAASALACLGGQMQTRLVLNNKDEINRAKKLGINDPSKKYNIEDMVRGDVFFCATGVTSGDLAKGVKDLGNEFEVTTFALHKSKKINRVITNIYNK